MQAELKRAAESGSAAKCPSGVQLKIDRVKAQSTEHTRVSQYLNAGCVCRGLRGLCLCVRAWLCTQVYRDCGGLSANGVDFDTQPDAGPAVKMAATACGCSRAFVMTASPCWQIVFVIVVATGAMAISL